VHEHLRKVAAALGDITAELTELANQGDTADNIAGYIGTTLAAHQAGRMGGQADEYARWKHMRLMYTRDMRRL